MVHHDLRFVNAVVGLTAADGLGTAGIDAKFESADGFHDAGFVEAVPVFLDEHLNATTGVGRDVGADTEVLVKFGGISGVVPKSEVVARRQDEAGGGAAKRRAVLFKNKDGINVVIVVLPGGDVSDGRFGPPDFGGDLNNVGRANGCVLGEKRASIMDKGLSTTNVEDRDNRVGIVGDSGATSYTRG